MAGLQRIPWTKRLDLIVRRHDSDGWVLKDPLTLEYVFLNDSEFDIFSRLDGTVTIPQLLNRQRDISVAELAGFLKRLAGRKLIRRTTPSVTSALQALGTRPALLSWLRPVLQFLRLRIRLVNPTRWLDAALPFVRPLFQPPAIAAMLTLLAIACGLAVLHFDEIIHSLPNLSTLLGPRNLPLLLLVFVAVKVLHEAGHAFTSRYFGVECNEAGIMLLVMTPVLYTNVTDVWLLPRHQRLLVTAAGMFVELVLAAVCTVLWSLAAPGLTKAVLLNTMIVCSINTVLFNGNPLLKFDGYFLLADWMRLPNLHQRAAASVRTFFHRLLTAGELGGDEPPEVRHGFLLSYGLLSLAYRTALTIAILKLFQTLGREWKAEIVAAAISCVVLAGFVVVPLAGFLQELVAHFRSTNFATPARRRMLAVGGVLLVFLLLPLPHSVVAPAIVEPDAAAVYATLPGLVSPLAGYGDRVRSGDPLAELNNVELSWQRQRLQAELDETRLRLESLLRNPLTAGSPLIPTLRETVAAAEQRLRQFHAEVDALSVRSTRTGVLLPPRTVNVSRSDVLPEFWSGLPLDVRNRRAWVDRGTLLGYVGEPDTSCVVVAQVDEEHIGLLRPEQSVEFLATGGGTVPHRGIVERIAPQRTDSVPEELLAAGLAGGVSDGGKLRPAFVTYDVTVRLASPADQPVTPLYCSGRVRIRTDPVTLLSRITNYVSRTFGSGRR